MRPAVVNILEKIVARKRRDLERWKKSSFPQTDVEWGPRRSLAAALAAPPFPNLIAEIKKASPSAGVLRPDFRPRELAAAYQRGGAAAISVVTDGPFFRGELVWLGEIRPLTTRPLLRKDFIIDPWQLEESRAAGADAVLLIVAILDQRQLTTLLVRAGELGLECLVEVHDEAELERALAAGAMIIGVNNRNLEDFTVDLETTLRLRPLVPAARLLVSESGIENREQLDRLGKAGIAGALVGTSLVRAADPETALRRLRGEAV